jgi:hypothetical protein
MIKPFTILKTNVEVDNTTTVFFKVLKTVVQYYEGELRPVTDSLETAINVPASITDIDKFLYQHLTKSGWIDE